MHNRLTTAIASAILLSIASTYTNAESQAEYAEKALPSWKQQNQKMENSYARLLSEAEAEQNKLPAQQLIQAKEKWEEFRNSFCKSISTTYGGTWGAVHESECRVKLANQFQSTIDSYGW